MIQIYITFLCSSFQADDNQIIFRTSDPWYQELHAKLELVQQERAIYDDMPDAAREHYSFSSDDISMGTGEDWKARNRSSSCHERVEDQNIASDTKMASVTIGMTTRSKQTHSGRESPSKRVLSAKERLSPRVYLKDEFTRDNARMSYRLSKEKLHPHFDSPPTEMARKPKSPPSSPPENDGIMMNEGFEKNSTYRIRRRKSMTLAMLEGEVMVSGGSGSDTPRERRLRSPNGETTSISSTPRTPDELKSDSRGTTSPEVFGSAEQLKYGSSSSLRSSKEKLHRSSYSAESKTVKTQPPPRRALSSLSDRGDKDQKLKPKDFMAKLRQNFSRKSKKEKKPTPVISSPIARVDSGILEQPQMEEGVQLRDKKTTNTRDPSARLTWHGTTDSDGRGSRSRRTSPGDSARYLSSADVRSGLESSKSTMNVAEFGRQIRPMADFYEQVSKTPFALTTLK